MKINDDKKIPKKVKINRKTGKMNLSVSKYQKNKKKRYGSETMSQKK